MNFGFEHEEQNFFHLSRSDIAFTFCDWTYLSEMMEKSLNTKGCREKDL